MFGLFTKLGLRALGFFGGGLGGYIAIGMTVTLMISGVIIYVLRDDLADANTAVGEATRAVAERDTAIRGLNSKIVLYEADKETTAKRHAGEIVLQAKIFTAQMGAQQDFFDKQKTIQKVIENDPITKSWADTLMPDDILRCLRGINAAACAAGGGRAAQDGVSGTTTVDDGTLPRAAAPGRHKRRFSLLGIGRPIQAGTVQFTNGWPARMADAISKKSAEIQR